MRIEIAGKIIHCGTASVHTDMPNNPNPQGKASLPLLSNLQAWRNAVVPHRSVRDLMVDYLTGLLVLSSEFSFKPVPQRSYYLYYRQGRWQLSLIGPGEWRPSRHRCFVARCRLQYDATWAIEPAADIDQRPDMVAALRAYRHGFEQRVRASQTIQSDLPHYDRTLPYYRRVLASGLASSLQASLETLGLQHADGQALLNQLQQEVSLPQHAKLSASAQWEEP